MPVDAVSIQQHCSMLHVGTPTHPKPSWLQPSSQPSSKGNLPHLVGQVPVQVSSWLSCSSRGDAQSPPSTPQREQDHHKGPLSAETFLQKMCWFGRPLSYSWAILFDAMDCLHVSVSKRDLHFVFLSTILSFPYSVPWPCLGVLSQNTRRCQGKFSPWWKSCQA